MDATVVAAPLVCLNERLGVLPVESDLRQDDDAPRSWVLSLERRPESTTAAGEIWRHRVRCDELATVGIHPLDVVERNQNNRDRVPEGRDAWLLASQSTEAENGRRIH